MDFCYSDLDSTFHITSSIRLDDVILGVRPVACKGTDPL